ncbi:tetratricopeptide repeat protein [Legionella septentrionalis]|uniref:tetratricopeptide repeat protein n=1 Tax=Legionella septentrionalis TaxID=2498109 RepID=UPI000F8C9B60|nr:sel1 repeat family protein [Legionella septentrionalis]RUR11032.1 sel1 repeat family protein [Legionella septentrionalis]
MPILELAFKILLDDALNGKVEALNKWEEHAEAHLFTTEQIKQALGVFRACDGSCLFRKSNALFLEAVWYHYGLLDDSGHSKTILYYEASIKLGHSTAMNNRAAMHVRGEGGEINSAEACRLYEAAIELGNAMAIYNRAYMHAHGLGGDKNYREALALYREYESKTHVKLDISDLHKKIITELKGNHELGNLYAQIDQMFQHGEAIGSAKGERVKAHAKNLEAKLDAFLLKHYEGNSLTGEKEQAFKAEFTQYLHSKDKDMGEHRAMWKPIIANILIALTGIGFVALLAKIIAHALTSHINKTDFSLNKACFFAETRTQCLALEIEQANNWTLCKA